MSEKPEEQAVVNLNPCKCGGGAPSFITTKITKYKYFCKSCGVGTDWYNFGGNEDTAAKDWNAANPLPSPVQADNQPDERAEVESWSKDTMRLINKLTPDIQGKAFDPDWFLLRQRLEQFEASILTREQPLRQRITELEKEVHAATHAACAASALINARAETGQPKCSFCGFEPHQIKDCPACQNEDKTLHLLMEALKREQPLRQRISELEITQRINQQTIDNFIHAVGAYKEQNQTLRDQRNKLVKAAKLVLNRTRDCDFTADQLYLQSILTSLKTKAQEKGGKMGLTEKPTEQGAGKAISAEDAASKIAAHYGDKLKTLAD